LKLVPVDVMAESRTAATAAAELSVSRTAVEAIVLGDGHRMVGLSLVLRLATRRSHIVRPQSGQVNKRRKRADRNTAIEGKPDIPSEGVLSAFGSIHSGHRWSG